MVKTNRLGLPDANYTLGSATRHALANIRRRKGRTFITGMGILLGISFIVTLVTYSSLFDHFDPESNIARKQWYLFLVGLLLCVVGVADSIYMEVGERIGEIGTYMTLGTLPQHIIKLFLLEAAITGFFAGIAGSITGIILGIGLAVMEFDVSAVMDHFMGEMSFYGLVFVTSVVLSGILTVIAAILPAYRASRLNPADAIRSV
ncbi:MAG: ABC transporter permease [Candidatus Odinarchaeota archaeon]